MSTPQQLILCPHLPLRPVKGALEKTMSDQSTNDVYVQGASSFDDTVAAAMSHGLKDLETRSGSIGSLDSPVVSRIICSVC